jgi:hypothetical protein
MAGRLVRQTSTDYGQKIADFLQAFVSLKQVLNLSYVVQATFVSARTLEGVDKLGM